MTVYQIEPSRTQQAYDELKGVANVCDDDDLEGDRKGGVADSYISGCDLANLEKGIREKTSIPLTNIKGGGTRFAKSDEMLRLIYSNLRRLDAKDGNLDGRIESKAPLSIEVNEKDWNAVERENKSSVVGIKLTMANGAQNAGSAFVVGCEEVERGGKAIWRHIAWTAAHAVDRIYESESDVRVVLFNNEEIQGINVIGVDHYLDFGVIAFESEMRLDPVKLGNSDDAKPLDEIMTLGNRLDEGIVSMRGQVVSTGIGGGGGHYKFDIIKVNDSSTGGDSGGPTFNEGGEVIGIVFRVEKGDAGGNLSVLIPINRVKEAAKGIMDAGKVEYAYAGFNFSTLETGVRKGLGLNRGIFVSHVDPDSPAQKAGLFAGDIILKVDGRGELANIAHQTKLHMLLTYIMSEKRPGETLSLTVLRSGEQREIGIKLGTRSFGRLSSWQTKYQFTAVELSNEIRMLSKVKENGVFVELDNKNAKKTSYMLPGNSVITHVGNERVSSVDDFKKAVAREGKKGQLVFRYISTIWSGDSPDYVGYVSVPTK